MSHVFADRQKFKITNSELFLPESDEDNNVAEQFSNAKNADDNQANSFAARENYSNDFKLAKLELELADFRFQLR